MATANLKLEFLFERVPVVDIQLPADGRRIVSGTRGPIHCLTCPIPVVVAGSQTLSLQPFLSLVHRPGVSVYHRLVGPLVLPRPAGHAAQYVPPRREPAVPR